MAGVSDQPFRSICAAYGAGLVVSEMVTSDTRLWSSRKSLTRLQWAEQKGPNAIQIAGSEPAQMASAAKACVIRGADIVDINMGCPAKKVCNKAAGSALLKDERLVADILSAVVAAVSVPVTLKIRTGWDSANKNALSIARIAQDCGIQALTIHGRTRACRFTGEAEYDTIASVAQAISIPIIANGDIDCAHKAKLVLQKTNAQAVMIGRAAQGNPWLFAQINHYLSTGELAAAPSLSTIHHTVIEHLQQLQQFYGDYLGPRIARKHMAWYIAKHLSATPCIADGDWRRQFNTLTTLKEQLNTVERLFERLYQLEDQAA